ncbi:MAG: hypothetical protein ACFFBR_11240 [Promethearchaeota archaeon]
MAKNNALVLTGIVLALVAAIIAILLGVSDLANSLPSVNLVGIAYGIIYFALGLLALVFCIRMYRRYNSTYFILLLVFSIIFIVLGGFSLSLTALVGILMLIGVILIFAGKA